MTRASAFGLGLMTFALFAWGALGDDPQRTRICTPGFSATIRPSATATNIIKRSMMRARGIPEWCIHRIKLDHICPLELDCAPLNLGNLQLQRNDIAAAKDYRKNRARDDYCNGDIELPEARARFTRDEPEMSVFDLCGMAE